MKKYNENVRLLEENNHLKKKQKKLDHFKMSATENTNNMHMDHTNTPSQQT